MKLNMNPAHRESWMRPAGHVSVRCDCTVVWLDSLRVILLDRFSRRGNLLIEFAGGASTWHVVASDGSSFCWPGVADGSCGGLEDGHQETEGVPLEGRCGNALLWHMLPLTD